MKIAIQGHPTRGKEVIQILESLGGKNKWFHYGNNENCFYELHDDCILCATTQSEYFKYYTLEEFEKEFPFKVGDKVTFKDDNYPYTIKAFDIWSDGDIICEFVENGLHYSINKIKPYKEMKEERNIKLTLDKAKEWYKKGGELKEIALQAFTENELNPLPRSWEEFCKNYPKTVGEAFTDTLSIIFCCDENDTNRDPHKDKNYCPSKKSAEAHLAMIQLEQLRNCWWGDWKPEWNNSEKFIIKWDEYNLTVLTARCIHAFLVFPTRKMAEGFLRCFIDLIEKAGDLI